MEDMVQAAKEGEKVVELFGVYSIFDLKGLRYDKPFFALTDLMAKRRFIMAVRNEGGLVANFRSDFELHRLANWNTNTGEFFTGFETIMEGKEIQE